jgi:hypothetical protein
LERLEVLETAPFFIHKVLLEPEEVELIPTGVQHLDILVLKYVLLVGAGAVGLSQTARQTSLEVPVVTLIFYLLEQVSVWQSQEEQAETARHLRRQLPGRATLQTTFKQELAEEAVTLGIMPQEARVLTAAGLAVVAAAAELLTTVLPLVLVAMAPTVLF